MTSLIFVLFSFLLFQTCSSYNGCVRRPTYYPVRIPVIFRPPPITWTIPIYFPSQFPAPCFPRPTRSPIPPRTVTFTQPPRTTRRTQPPRTVTYREPPFTYTPSRSTGPLPTENLDEFLRTMTIRTTRGAPITREWTTETTRRTTENLEEFLRTFSLRTTRGAPITPEWTPETTRRTTTTTRRTTTTTRRTTTVPETTSTAAPSTTTLTTRTMPSTTKETIPTGCVYENQTALQLLAITKTTQYGIESYGIDDVITINAHDTGKFSFFIAGRGNMSFTYGRTIIISTFAYTSDFYNKDTGFFEIEYKAKRICVDSYAIWNITIRNEDQGVDIKLQLKLKRGMETPDLSESAWKERMSTEIAVRQTATICKYQGNQIIAMLLFRRHRWTHIQGSPILIEVGERGVISLVLRDEITFHKSEGHEQFVSYQYEINKQILMIQYDVSIKAKLDTLISIKLIDGIVITLQITESEIKIEDPTPGDMKIMEVGLCTSYPCNLTKVEEKCNLSLNRLADKQSDLVFKTRGNSSMRLVLRSNSGVVYDYPLHSNIDSIPFEGLRNFQEIELMEVKLINVMTEEIYHCQIEIRNNQSIIYEIPEKVEGENCQALGEESSFVYNILKLTEDTWKLYSVDDVIEMEENEIATWVFLMVGNGNITAHVEKSHMISEFMNQTSVQMEGRGFMSFDYMPEVLCTDYPKYNGFVDIIFENLKQETVVNHHIKVQRNAGNKTIVMGEEEWKKLVDIQKNTTSSFPLCPSYFMKLDLDVLSVIQFDSGRWRIINETVQIFHKSPSKLLFHLGGFGNYSIKSRSTDNLQISINTPEIALNGTQMIEVTCTAKNWTSNEENVWIDFYDEGGLIKSRNLKISVKKNRKFDMERHVDIKRYRQANETQLVEIYRYDYATSRFIALRVNFYDHLKIHRKLSDTDDLVFVVKGDKAERLRIMSGNGYTKTYTLVNNMVMVPFMGARRWMTKDSMAIDVFGKSNEHLSHHVLEVIAE